MTRTWAVGLLLLAAAVGTGCDATAHALWVLWPGAREREVPAEFAGLKGKTVAIVVYCDNRVAYEHPQVQLTLSSAVAGRLRKHVKDVRIVDPGRVVNYQLQNIYWDEMDKTELGKVFAADYVLFIALVEFSTREPGALHLYHGRINAQAALYQTSLAERKARVWQAPAIRIQHPEDSSVGLPGESNRQVRDLIEGKFADVLAKKFYDHKVPLE
jgi:hypothetical protein